MLSFIYFNFILTGKSTKSSGEEVLLLHCFTTSNISITRRMRTSRAKTLALSLRCRPLNDYEKSRGYVSITRLVDDKVVIVLDPEHLKERGKEEYARAR